MTYLDQFSEARGIDRLEIQHQIFKFCRAIDRGNFAELIDVYHPDATHDHGLFKGSARDFSEWIAKRHATIAFSNHQAGNIYIEFVSETQAFVETYAMVWQSVTPSASMMVDDEDGEYELISCSRYVDEFTRRDSRWRIQNRTVVPGHIMRIPDGSTLSLAPGFAVGTRDGNDVAEQLRREMGTTE
jgi:hypothetical protein